MKEAEVLLEAQVKNFETPSVAYLIFSCENIIDQYSTGLAQVENHIQADGSTTYNAFSVTKTFTALAVLQLAEQKLLNLHDQVKNLIPDFPYSPEITVTQWYATWKSGSSLILLVKEPEKEPLLWMGICVLKTHLCPVIGS